MMCRLTRAIAAGFLLACLLGFTSASARGSDPVAPSAAARSVVPRPRYVRAESGSYVWPARARIGIGAKSERNVAEWLRTYLAEIGIAATVVGRTAKADVVLRAAAGSDARLGDEGYVLHVRRSGIAMHANSPRGLFYALQTLEQISTRSGRAFTSPAATIVDWPAYRWRGIHLDVARHFFAVPVIERYIDVAAHYKLNVFHWHLTDDAAWRLQDDRYPALGAGGERYSPADVRRIVAYAARRYVTVMPEIEMPAHADTVLRRYPRLSCGHATLCASGAGLVFARAVLNDVMDAFPSRYVHAGGDEVPPAAAATQPQFTRQIERTVEARGRRLVGWDEIFTPQLSPRAVVMVWTARKRAAEAARRGNDVIVASGPLYFDGAQGDAAQEPRATRHMATLEEVYADGVLPAGLAAREIAHVLGAQANVWTEHIATPQHLFYMALPRELALAEIVWTPRERKSWDSFLARLPAQFAWLEAHHYAFRIPNASFALSGGRTVFTSVPGHVQSVRAWTDARRVTVALSVPLADAVIRYTTDGTAPTAKARAYRGPFTVAAGRGAVTLRAAAFLHGRAGAITECVVASSSRAAMHELAHASTSWSGLVSP